MRDLFKCRASYHFVSHFSYKKRCMNDGSQVKMPFCQVLEFSENVLHCSTKLISKEIENCYKVISKRSLSGRIEF